ncbi:PqqD family protein [Microbacterium sp. SD291]|uniref:PqqD family protein n=1 Tax=Microbacterium sp. SD291 TaxID=2782007 RepID=UPI001A96F128|nr:PqqD family protein [Microbacterium sp. SD291]MBO0980987.1 PqqD family protein [Microbacterium sp. SD291]
MSPAYLPAEAVGVIQDGDSVYVANLPRGPIVVLEGTAALVWKAACSGPADTLAERVAAAVGEDVAAIETGMAEFIADLVERGLLAAA